MPKRPNLLETIEVSKRRRLGKKGARQNARAHGRFGQIDLLPLLPQHLGEKKKRPSELQGREERETARVVGRERRAKLKKRQIWCVCAA